MLIYDRQIKPGLVALYDIWPGNGAGLFLQPAARTGHTSDKFEAWRHTQSPWLKEQSCVNNYFRAIIPNHLASNSFHRLTVNNKTHTPLKERTL